MVTWPVTSRTLKGQGHCPDIFRCKYLENEDRDSVPVGHNRLVSGLAVSSVDLRNYVLTVAILEFNMASTRYSKQWSYCISLPWKLAVNRRKCFSICLNFEAICNKIMFKEHRVCPMSTLRVLRILRYFYANISRWTWPLVSREVITQHVSAAIFKIMGTTYWGYELDLARSLDIIDRMAIQRTLCYFLLFPTGTESLSSTFSRYLHRNISGQWPWPFRVRDVTGYVTIWCPS